LIVKDAATDDLGNHYVLAFHWIDSGFTKFQNIIVAAHPKRPNIIIKYNNSKQILWIKQFSNAEANYMSYSKNDKTLYISATGIADTTYMESYLLPKGGFVAKLDLNGNCIWAKNISDYGAYNISSDQLNNVYVLNNDNMGQGYKITKIDYQGNPIWSHYLGSEGGILAADSVGNCYVTGSRYSNSPIVENNYFLEKISTNGTVAWSIRSTQGTLGFSIFVNNKGYIYTAGEYGNQDNDSLPSGIGIGKYDMNGNEIWSYQHADINKNIITIPNEIIETNGFVYVAGILNHQFPDGFLLKLNEPGISTSLENLNNSKKINIFPNPGNKIFTVIYRNEYYSPVTIRVKTLTGQVIYSKVINGFNGELKEVIDIGKQAEGTYLLQLEQENSILTKKIIVR
jgi:hypothetical protein